MSNLTLEQKMAYLEQQLKEIEEMKKSLKSSMSNLAREKNKKPIVWAIHEAQSSGKFSLRIERGAVKHYLTPDFIEFIVNHADDLKKACVEINKLNDDRELSQTTEKKVA
jgi:hypothetical protein